MCKDFGVADQVVSQVVSVLVNCFPAVRGEIGADSKLIEDLCMDSIGLVEIVMALNESFGIELPEEGVEVCRTVKDLCSLVETCSRDG